MSWERLRLSQVIEIKKGKAITKKGSKEGPYPVILGGREPAYYIDKYNHTGKAIVVSRSGASAGYVSFWNEPIFVTDGFLVEPKNTIDIDFLYYFMKNHESELMGLQGGSAIPHVTPKIIGGIEGSIPSMDVQEKIINILKPYDALIENNQKQIKLLEEAAQRLYKEWFVDLHFPGYEDVKIVDGVPEEWEVHQLSEVFDYVRGKSYKSSELSDTDGVLMANLKNIKAFGGYNRNNEKRFIGKYKSEQTIKSGDLIMGVTDMTQERRLVGHVALVPDMREEMTFSMDLIKLIPKLSSNVFLYSTMFFGEFSKKISPLANGTNVLHLKPESMMTLEMIIPDVHTLKMFDDFIGHIIKKIEILQNQCDFAVESRDRLLPKLMSGEIEV